MKSNHDYSNVKVQGDRYLCSRSSFWRSLESRLLPKCLESVSAGRCLPQALAIRSGQRDGVRCAMPLQSMPTGSGFGLWRTVNPANFTTNDLLGDTARSGDFHYRREEAVCQGRIPLASGRLGQATRAHSCRTHHVNRDVPLRRRLAGNRLGP